MKTQKLLSMIIHKESGDYVSATLCSTCMCQHKKAMKTSSLLSSVYVAADIVPGKNMQTADHCEACDD